jgi:hypothetical protein
MKLEFPPLNMLLRNGKVKPQFPKCQECNEFYAHKKFKWKCSNCHGICNNINSYPWKDKYFQEKIKTYCECNFNHCQKYYGMLKQIVLLNNTPLLKNVIVHIIKEINWSGFFIPAEFGEELLRRTGRDSIEKSHLICPLILNWWNMRDLDYKNYELCYYGRYGDDPTGLIRSFPPPSPLPSSFGRP